MVQEVSNNLIYNAIQDAVGDPFQSIGANIIIQNADKNIGYYFDVIDEHSISIQNQITDNFLENNTAVQDHIAHNPITVSLNGLSGEIVFEQPNWALDKLSNEYGNLMPEKLKILPGLIPNVDNLTQIAKNTIQYVESSYKRYEKVIKNITQNTRDTRLRQIYKELKALSDANAKFIVETPYATFENMYIQSITLRQGNENYITDLGITLKQIQYANVSVTEADKEVLAKYTQYAKAQIENNGKTKSIKTNVSILRDNYNKISSYGRTH